MILGKLRHKLRLDKGKNMLLSNRLGETEDFAHKNLTFWYSDKR